ncbi:hypothetical protein ROP_01370 [Rhodococcus opacus B4]|uniref:Uncharacterized protein n=1 Tax=Rhodococcus opacus (strain B4) TaxID=632772 RepID=C1ASD5_RHOOB|nr:hypothetical protein ROP_01370 [Rhodococcus opacus B4]
MRITDSARKHHISNTDITHAFENAIRYAEYEDDGEERLLIIGTDTAGRLLEPVAAPAGEPNRRVRAAIAAAASETTREGGRQPHCHTPHPLTPRRRRPGTEAGRLLRGGTKIRGAAGGAGAGSLRHNGLRARHGQRQGFSTAWGPWQRRGRPRYLARPTIARCGAVRGLEPATSTPDLRLAD